MSTLAVSPFAEAPDRRRWWILFTILSVEVMDLLDGTVVNVAGPAIRGSLGTSLSALQWISGGYALTFAIGLVTGGRLGDLFGRKRMFLIGVMGFVVSSLACGLAPNTEALIALRLVQGLFAASMIPQGFGIVREVFPPEELGKAFGLFGPVIGGSALLGPILGGVLVDANLFGVGWRLIFLINVPIGLVAFSAASKLFPVSKSATTTSLDVGGALLVSLAAGLLIYPLIQGPELDWPWWTFALLVGGVATLGLFTAWERAREGAGRAPLVSMRLFRMRAFSAGLWSTMVFFCGLIGLSFVLSSYLQIGHGFSTVKTGLSFVPWALGTAIGAGVSAGALAPRFGRKVLLGAIGVLMLGVGGLLGVAHASAGGEVTMVGLVVAQLLCGLGMGAVISPLFNFILSGVGPEDTGSASGVLNAVQQLGGGLGIAVMGTLFFTTLKSLGPDVAFQRALWVELGLLAACVVSLRLLPEKLREETSP